MVKTKRLNHPLTFGFSLSSIAQPVNVVEALCVLSRGKTHELAPRQVFRVLVHSLSYYIVAGFLFEIGTVPLFRYMKYEISYI